jgi:hypothetical protein
MFKEAYIDTMYLKNEKKNLRKNPIFYILFQGIKPYNFNLIFLRGPPILPSAYIIAYIGTKMLLDYD